MYRLEGSRKSQETPQKQLGHRNSQSLNEQPGILPGTDIGLLHISDSFVACSTCETPNNGNRGYLYCFVWFLIALPSLNIKGGAYSYPNLKCHALLMLIPMGSPPLSEEKRRRNELGSGGRREGEVGGEKVTWLSEKSLHLVTSGGRFIDL